MRLKRGSLGRLISKSYKEPIGFNKKAAIGDKGFGGSGCVRVCVGGDICMDYGKKGRW